MADYTYTGKVLEPNLDQVYADVQASPDLTAEHKADYTGCTWRQSAATIVCTFGTALDGVEETAFNAIVDANDGV